VGVALLVFRRGEKVPDTFSSRGQGRVIIATVCSLASNTLMPLHPSWQLVGGELDMDDAAIGTSSD